MNIDQEQMMLQMLFEKNEAIKKLFEEKEKLQRELDNLKGVEDGPIQPLAS